MSGRWEDCPCCGEATFADGSIQWDGTRVPCGCECWVSIDADARYGHITMGDGPCPACDAREQWLDDPDSGAKRAARWEAWECAHRSDEP